MILIFSFLPVSKVNQRFLLTSVEVIIASFATSLSTQKSMRKRFFYFFAIQLDLEKRHLGARVH